MITYQPTPTNEILSPVEDDTTVDYGTLIPETAVDRALLARVIDATPLLQRSDITIWDSGETWDAVEYRYRDLKTAKVRLGREWHTGGELKCELIPDVPFDPATFLLAPSYPIFVRVCVTYDERIEAMWRLPQCPISLGNQSNGADYLPVLTALASKDTANAA